MLMLLLDVFDCPRTRDTLAWSSRADTHRHIVTTFEVKKGGVLAQSLGILGGVR
jgi:hypothetical protein